MVPGQGLHNVMLVRPMCTQELQTADDFGQRGQMVLAGNEI
jgi:hypothetical protein